MSLERIRRNIEVETKQLYGTVNQKTVILEWYIPDFLYFYIWIKATLSKAVRKERSVMCIKFLETQIV